MISLKHSNKLIYLVFFIYILNFGLNPIFAAVDIWKQNEKKDEKNNQITNEGETTIESPIISEDIQKVIIKIDENKIEDSDQSVIGIFDPEKNNFNLDMWSKSDGEDIKKILNRINRLKLSKLSENLLFQVLFTNAYPPKTNLTSEEFLKIKVNWLIKRKRIQNLETLLKINPEVGQNSKAIKYLINEYISSADIKSACEKINFIDRKVQNS